MTGLQINSNVFIVDSDGVDIYSVVAVGDRNVSVGDMTGLHIYSDVSIGDSSGVDIYNVVAAGDMTGLQIYCDVLRGYKTK